MKEVIILDRGERKLPKDIARQLINSEPQGGKPVNTYDGRVYVPRSKWRRTKSKKKHIFIKGKK